MGVLSQFLDLTQGFLRLFVKAVMQNAPESPPLGMAADTHIRVCHHLKKTLRRIIKGADDKLSLKEKCCKYSLE